MKKVLASLFLLFALIQNSSAQTKPVRGKSFGFSIIGNDFATAQSIRATSVSEVLRDKKWAKFRDMGHGFAFHYYKGVSPVVDFVATIGGSFVEFDLPGKNIDDNNFLLEVDASANFKMFTEEFTFNPYLIAGVGASKYTNVFGAFIPLGGGVKINLFNEAQIFTQLQYRVPVTTEASSHHFQVSFGISGLL